MVGEYGWGLPGLPNFLNELQTNQNVAGDMFWSILPDENGGSTPEPHNSQPPDSYGQDDSPLYMPGTDSTMNSAITEFTNHAQAMSTP